MRRGVRREIVTSGAFALLVFQAGCSTATLTAGANLAKAGQAASTQMEQNVTISAESMTALRKAVAFNDGFNGVLGNASSAQFLSNMSGIQGKLGQYGKLLNRLTDAYAALGDLSSYDAAGTLETAIDKLASDTQSFGAAVGHPVAIPTEATTAVTTAGGLALSAAQARRVKAESAEIEAVLKQIIAILDDPRTRAKLVPVQTEVAGQIDQTTTVLFLKGLYSYQPLIDDLGRPMGLKAVDGAEDKVKADPKLSAGFRNVAVEMSAEQVADLAASYDKSLAALKALVPLHESLARGEAMDLATLTRITGELQTIAAKFQKPKGGS